MKSLALKFAASSLALGLATGGFQLDRVSLFVSSATASEARPDEQAAQLRASASQALVRGDTAAAITAIEQAVALAPRDVGYRMMLGDVYMKSGRFQSAEIAYRDVLALDPGQTRVALSLALMQVANGRSQDAVAQLEEVEGRASPADLGLAYALAGSTRRAVDILEPAARATGASARIRQNLALAYAIGGDWGRARTIAAQDLSPAEVSGRMTQWASLARSPADHVASLLGVSPVQDPGLPVRLALADPVSQPQEPVTRIAFAEAAPAAPIQLPMPIPAAPAENAADLPPEPVAVPMPVAAPAAAVVEAPAAYAEVEQANWGLAENGSVRLPEPAPEARELPVQVQYAAAAEALVRPDPVVAAAPVRERPLRRAVRVVDQISARPAVTTSPVRSANGRYVVQIGAFSSAANAERAWQQAERNFGLRSEQPVTMTFGHNGRLLHRVAIAGFDRRGDASSLCATIQARGGTCFVRSNAGDASIRWAARYSRRA